MIESEAVVLRVENDHAWVRIRPHAPCGHCDPETGCKTVAMTRMFSGNKQEFTVLNPIAAREGDLVKVAIADGVLLKSALRGYGLPLAGVLAGAAAGRLLFGAEGADLASLAGAIAGAVLALGVLRYHPRSPADEPRIVSRHEPGLPMLSSCRTRDRMLGARHDRPSSPA